MKSYICCTYSHVVTYIEWGNPNEEQYYQYIHSYAPYHNIQSNTKYPALLVTTGLHDPRVAYWEGAKWVAKLRNTYRESTELRGYMHTILLKTDMNAGHFSASDRYKYIKEMSYEYAFMIKYILPEQL